MTQSSQQARDDQQLKNYLLGKLSPCERAHLEDRYFANDATFAKLQVLEKKLIREYLRGRLADREEFESALAQMPLLRQKVLRHAGRTWTPLRLATVTVALLILVSVAWSYRWATSELEFAHQQIESLKHEMTKQSVEAPALMLLQSLHPGVLRGRDGVAHLPADVTLVRFRLHLPPDPTDAKYDVVLKRTGDATVLVSSANLPRRADGLVEFDCSAHLLERGDYTITLSQIGSASTSTYRFLLRRS